MPKIAQADTVSEDRGSVTLTKTAPALEQSSDTSAVAKQEERPTLPTAAEAHQPLRRSTKETNELGRAVMDLLMQQARHNMQTAAAVARAISLTEVAEVQRDFIGGSIERMNKLGERYRMMLQAGTKTVAFPGRP